LLTKRSSESVKDRARDSGILASIERAPESEINGHRVPDEYTALDNGPHTALAKIETDATGRPNATAA
jgi:hypothetical protein